MIFVRKNTPPTYSLPRRRDAIRNRARKSVTFADVADVEQSQVSWSELWTSSQRDSRDFETA